MNKVILTGRLADNPEVRYSGGEKPTAIARYRLVVDRKFKKEGDQQTADFINCVAFGRQGEFAEKYLCKGIKINLIGRIQTGSYTNRNGQKVYTTDVVVEEQEFVETKEVNQARFEAAGVSAPIEDAGDGFDNIPDDMDDMPFN